MSLERRNPLPAGRYWLDVFAPNLDAAAKWFQTNSAKVKVRETESFQANAGGPARDFRIFEVLEPVDFPQKLLGFPTIAPPNVQGSSDTVQRPPPEKDLLDTLEPLDPFRLVVQAVTAVGVGVGLFLAVKALKSN